MSWVKRELQDINLGDKRLEKRSFKLLETLSSNPSANLPEACGGWSETKAAYRFFENKSVSGEKILQPHKASTIKRMSQCKVVLLIQDTTQLNYSSQYKKEGIGPLKNKHHKGILLHPTIAVTPERLCLGVVDDYHWHRDKLHNLTKKERSKLNLETPITKKESYRWIMGYQRANTLAKKLPSTHLINIADREGDIYDLYHEAYCDNSEIQADWLIRAVKNRPILNNNTGERASQNLWETVNSGSPKGYMEFTLPKRGNNPSRKVKQAIRSKKVWFYPPKNRKGKLPCGPVQVNAVVATELNPPDTEKPIEWLFITSLAIDTINELKLIFQYYLCRWQIEVFFKVLKSGCRIEKLQLTTKERMDSCLAMYLIVAWRTLFITLFDRSTEEVDCEIIFEKEEWKMLYIMTQDKKPPEKPPQLRVVIRMLAKLGGFLDRKGDGPPGPTTIWKGLAKLKQALFVKQMVATIYG